MIKAEDLEGRSPSRTCRCTSTSGSRRRQDRSLADVWSALGGELKPSLDLVVTAPIMVDRDAPFGPPVLAGPVDRDRVDRRRRREVVASSGGAGAATESDVERRALPRRSCVPTGAGHEASAAASRSGCAACRTR